MRTFAAKLEAARRQRKSRLSSGRAKVTAIMSSAKRWRCARRLSRPMIVLLAFRLLGGSSASHFNRRKGLVSEKALRYVSFPLWASPYEFPQSSFHFRDRLFRPFPGDVFAIGARTGACGRAAAAA